VLAQQWAEAIALIESEPCVAGGCHGSYLSAAHASRQCRAIASLPCAVDVVDEMLGGAA
jgi:hypothetical protein